MPLDDYICTISRVHQQAVDQVKAKMPAPEELFEVSTLFKILGDRTRVGILSALSQAELCVCDLCAVLNMSPSAVSHQLRLLKSSRLVRFRREGKFVFYSLNDEHVQSLLEQALDHTQEQTRP